MKPRHLLLVRHARASWDQGAAVDFDRRLTSQGEKDADALAGWLHVQAPRPSAIVASPAPRARDTAVRLAAAWEAAPALTMEPTLYEAPLDGPSRLAAKFLDAWESVMMIGHNPSISHTADWLIGEPTILELPTGGMVWLELNVSHWRELGPGRAQVRAVHVPSGAEV